MNKNAYSEVSTLPSGFTSEQWVDGVETPIEQLKSKPGALLPILHEIQNSVGYIPYESIACACADNDS